MIQLAALRGLYYRGEVVAAGTLFDAPELDAAQLLDAVAVRLVDPADAEAVRRAVEQENARVCGGPRARANNFPTRTW